MSPRAASRLETLGFDEVYDYVAGKADWFAAGLPREGTHAETPRAGDVARRDEVTCRLSEEVGDMGARLSAAGQPWCLVLGDEDVVLGRVRGDALDVAADTLVESIMEAGPTTARPDIEVDRLRARLERRNVPRIVITTSEGRLVGTFSVDEASSALPAEADEACLFGV